MKTEKEDMFAYLLFLIYQAGLFHDQLHAFYGKDGDGFACFNDLVVCGAGRPFRTFDRNGAAEIVNGRDDLPFCAHDGMDGGGGTVFAGENAQNNRNTPQKNDD